MLSEFNYSLQRALGIIGTVLLTIALATVLCSVTFFLVRMGVEVFRFRGRRQLLCPETGNVGGIRIAFRVISSSNRRLNMRVCDVMAKSPVYCRPETNLAAATALMWDKDCGALPVVGEGGSVTGIITDRDICIALGTRNVRGSEITVGQVTSRRALTCKADADIHTALNTMREAKIRRLPVVNDAGGLEGMLILDDLVLRAQHSDGAKPGISYEDVICTFRGIGQNRTRPDEPYRVAA